MAEAGHALVLTSTQSDEEAQHFHRALGYRDCGGFLLPFPGFEQSLEVILGKTVNQKKQDEQNRGVRDDAADCTNFGLGEADPGVSA